MKSEHRLLHLRLLVVVAMVLGSLMVGGVPVNAQTGTITSTATPSDATPATGDTITVAINIDMTGVDEPDNYLGSYTGSLAWDPAILDYISHGGPPAGFMGEVNDTNADAGIIIFNGINTTGATGNVIVLTITFNVVGTGTSALDVEYTAMSSAKEFNRLLDILTVTDSQVEVSSAPTCYALTLNHTGSGSDPVANPSSSAGCSAGQYVAGAVVSLTASPDAGWTVDSWTGTDNNSSTSTTNQVTMPAAARTATVNYVVSSENEVVSTATPSDDEPEAGDQIVVTINIDMSAAPAHRLGSFTGSLVWNPAVLAYDSHAGLPSGFSGAVNTANVGIGQIAFDGANEDGATGNVVVIQITFDVVGPGTSALNLEYSAMAAAYTLQSLMPILTVNDGQVDAASAGPYTLTMAVGPTGGGTTDPAVGPHSYAAGTVVDITAMPNTGYEFDYWEGDVADPNSASTMVTMNEAKTVTAHFIDNVPPNTDITAHPDDPSNSANASFSFTSTEVGSTFECRLDGGSFTACTSPQTYSGLTDGEHTFEVRAVDAAGNLDPTPASYTWTIDTLAPDTTITDQPDDPSRSASASFSFTSTKAGSTFECRLDGSTFSACTSPWTYTGLNYGIHTFEVRAIDAVGNTDPTPASYTWTIQRQIFLPIVVN
ncbi:MAG: hypothetical protein RBU35_09645 [Anaerolineae bacterium]|jgi:hypothetical protein|nr:hypothetical protein [Anaerolineae bacterium]